MLRRTLPFILLTLLCGGYSQVSAQTPAPNPQGENVSVAVDKSSDKAAEAAPEVNAETPAIKMPRPIFSTATTSRVGINQTQTLPLTLNDAIRRSLENNNDIEVARNDVRISETTLRSFEGAYDTFFSFTPAFSRSSQTNASASNNFQINGGLSQLIPVGGGSITPFFNNSRFGSGSQFNDPSAVQRTSSFVYTSSLGITYNQPLWRNRSIDNTRRNIRIQRKRLEQSDADFRRRTIETISGVQRAYWDLVFALRDQQNRQSNLDLTKENLRRVQAQIKAGAAAPLAEAEVATELATREADLLLAAQLVTTTENTLKQLLLKEPTAPEWSTPIIPTDEPSFDQTPVKLEDALTEARQNRPELQRLELQREINDIDVEYFKNQTKPRIDLNTTLSLDGTAVSGNASDADLIFPLIAQGEVAEQNNSSSFLLRQINILRGLQGLGSVQNIPNVTGQTIPGFTTGGSTQAFRNLFRPDAVNYSVGVTIELPLRNKTAKANLAGAQIAQTQLEATRRQQEQVVIVEVRNAVQAVETARQRIVTARIGRENAQKQLEGEQKLFEVGRSTTFVLFERENDLVRAKNEEIRAQTDYNKALADLQRATSTTLRSNNIVVESVVAP